MDFSKLTYNQIRDLSEQLKTSSSRMEAILEEQKALFAKVDSEGVWTGTAAESTRAHFDEVSAKFPEFYTAVSELAKHLDNVVSSYEAVDNSIIGGA